MIPDDPRFEAIARLRAYVDADKPKKLREGFAFERPLRHGWMLPYLMRLDELSWQRWAHWATITARGSLADEPIPCIEITQAHGLPGSVGRKMIERSLQAVTKYGDWRGWSSWTYFDYLLDWILFGLGDPHQREHPKGHSECDGASERLYQIFNLEPLLAYPYDHWGDILAENNYGRRAGFFPTPVDVCAMMVQMQMGGEDMRTKTVCDPAIGTGRMLLPASNYSYRLYGNDISATVLKACYVNFWLYAPWGVKPFKFLDNADEPSNTMKTNTPQYELPGTEQVFNLATETSEDGERIVKDREAKEQAAAEAEAKQLALL